MPGFFPQAVRQALTSLPDPGTMVQSAIPMPGPGDVIQGLQALPNGISQLGQPVTDFFTPQPHQTTMEQASQDNDRFLKAVVNPASPTSLLMPPAVRDQEMLKLISRQQAMLNTLMQVTGLSRTPIQYYA